MDVSDKLKFEDLNMRVEAQTLFAEHCSRMTTRAICCKSAVTDWGNALQSVFLVLEVLKTACCYWELAKR